MAERRAARACWTPRRPTALVEGSSRQSARRRSASGVGSASAGSSEAGMRWSCASMVSVCRGGVTVEVKALLPCGSPTPRRSVQTGSDPGRRRVPPWMPVNGSACRPTHNPMRWYLPVTPGISTGHSFLFGGLRAGRRHLRARGQHRSLGRLGHGAVPVLRPAAVGDGHRRHRRLRGPQHHPGPGRRHGRQHRDPDRERRARRPRAARQRASGRRCPTCRRPRSACPARAAGTSRTRS